MKNQKKQYNKKMKSRKEKVLKKKIYIIAIILFLMSSAIIGIKGYKYYNENVHLGKYTGLTTEMISYTVSEESIDKKLESFVAVNPTITEVKTGTIEEGNTVNVTYNEITEDVIAGTIEVGFEKAIVGMDVGKTLDLIIDGENYSVKINSIKIANESKLTDEFIKENTDCKTVEEYKKELENEFLENYEANARVNAGNDLIRQILKTSRVRNYPDEDVEVYKEEIRLKYQSAATQLDITLEKLLEYMNMTEEDFEKDLEIEANFKVNKKLIVEAIAKERFISVSDKEFKEYIADIEDYDEKNEEAIRYDALAEKVYDFLLKKNKVKKIEKEIDYTDYDQLQFNS